MRRGQFIMRSLDGRFLHLVECTHTAGFKITRERWVERLENASCFDPRMLGEAVNTYREAYPYFVAGATG